MVYRAVRISGNFFDHPILGIYQDPAAAMTHPTMAFDNPVKSVSLYFLFDVGKFKFSHVFLTF
jgi:hypothetical protein